ncbi:MAG: MBL fold metallo-hydrolase [Oligoflexales bacterium]
MKYLVPALVLFLNIGCNTINTGSSAAATNIPDPDAVTITKTEVAKNFYLFQGPNGDFLAFVGADGVLLVDSEYETSAEQVRKEVAALSSKPVKYIINTHWHPDHVGTNVSFGKDGTTIIAHENTLKRLSSKQYTRFDKATTLPIAEEGRPKKTYKTKMDLSFGGEQIEIFLAPNAHTDGDSVVYFRKSNIIELGDLYSNSAYPYLDLDSNGSIDALIAAMKKVAAMINKDTKVIAGHSNVSDLEEVKAYIAMLEDVRNKTNAMKQAGKTRDEILEANLSAEYNDTYFDDSYVKPNDFVSFVYDSSAVK